MVLLEDLDIDTLPAEMRTYLRTYTYIDARNYDDDLDRIRKRIRFVMPGTPLLQIREMQLGITNNDREQLAEDLTMAFHQGEQLGAITMDDDEFVTKL